jgi:hypothetical protein
MTNFEAIAITDERTDCDCCGKSGLKRTVVLKDENGEFVFFGTTCAARALGKKPSTRTQAEKAVNAAIAQAARDRHAAKRAELSQTVDALGKLLNWDYTPSENRTFLAKDGWLLNCGPRVRDRWVETNPAAVALLDRATELRNDPELFS